MIENLIGKKQSLQLFLTIDDLFDVLDQYENRIKNIITGQFENKLTQKNDELLTLDETASFLKKSKVTIHAWKKKGLIPYIRVSNKIYFRKSDLLNFDVINLKRRA